jgi:competence protein ComGC
MAAIMKSRTHSQRGLPLVEVFLVLATVALLMAFILPIMARAHVRPKQITCVSHLRQVGLVYRIWSNDQQLNGNRLRLHLASMTNTSIRLAIP